jgi:hypothetical protein
LLAAQLVRQKYLRRLLFDSFEQLNPGIIEASSVQQDIAGLLILSLKRINLSVVSV